MEISDQVSDLPSSLRPKVEFSIFRRPSRAPVPSHPAASGSAHSPRPDPVHGHPAVSSLTARLPSHPAAPMRPDPVHGHPAVSSPAARLLTRTRRVPARAFPLLQIVYISAMVCYRS